MPSQNDPNQMYVEFVPDSELVRMSDTLARLGGDHSLFEKCFNDDEFTLYEHWGYRPLQLRRAISVLQGEADDAPVTEQLKACLFALTVDEHKAPNQFALVTPELVHQAQLRLNRLLMDFPILMHPCIRVPTYEQEQSGVCSVPHAIAMSRRGRFPMRRDGVSREQQRDWVRVPSVMYGLRAEPRPFKNRIARVMSNTPAGVTRHTRHRPTMLLASLHELNDAVYLPGDMVHRFHHGMLPQRPERYPEDLSSGIYMMCFFDALGVVSGDKCPEFIEAMRQHRVMEWPDNVQKMSRLLPNHVFGGKDGVEFFGSIADRTQLLLDGLVACGFCPTLLSAAKVIQEAIADRGARNLAAGEIYELLHVLDRAGLHDLEGERFGMLGSGTTWREAAQVVRRENAMRAVIGTDNEEESVSSKAPRTKRATI